MERSAGVPTVSLAREEAYREQCSGRWTMKRSTDRILTTHAGRLPSPPDVTETVRAIQRGEPHDREAFGRRVRAMTAEVVRQQGETGVEPLTRSSTRSWWLT